ncbi:MAG: nucleotidyltransferase family protein, partial [Chloroflexota bacterium]|nr:nucleotidyltransferase family protein [Chloroflexota bacterium]
GFHTARAYFPDPGTRPLTDIDLLVSEADFDRAPPALRAAGLVESEARSARNRRDWIPAGAGRKVRSLELCHADNPWSIDLHVSLDRTMFRGCTVGFGPVRSADAAARVVLERCVRVLAQPLLTAFLALHTSQELQSVPLLRLVELVLVIRRDRAEGRLEWEALRALLVRTGTARFVFPAFALLEKLAPGTLDPALHEELTAAATPRMRRVLQRTTPANVQRLDHMSVEEKFMWAAGPGDVVRRLSQFIRPLGTDGSLADLGRTYYRWLSRLRRGRVAR